MDLIADKELIDRKNNLRVYKARFVPMDEWICIKEYTFQELHEANAYVNEALHQQSIQHPNVCQIKQFFLEQSADDWKAVIVIEWLPSTLHNDLKKRKKQHRPWTDSELMGLLTGLIDALASAQEKNISHRDLSLNNLLMSEDGRVKIGDFGYSKWEINQLDAQTYIGTPAYFSPELRKASSDAINRMCSEKVHHNLYKSDVYALGVCFLFMATLTDNPESLGSSQSLAWDAFLSAANALQGYDTLKPVLVSMLTVSEESRPDFVELSRMFRIPSSPRVLDRGTNPYDLLAAPSIAIQSRTQGVAASPFSDEADLAVDYPCEECKQQMKCEGGRYCCPDPACIRNRNLLTEVPSAAISAAPRSMSSDNFARASCVQCEGMCSLATTKLGKKVISLPCNDSYCSLPCFLTYVGSRTCNFQLRNSLCCPRCQQPFYYKFVYDCVGGARAYFQLSLSHSRVCVECSRGNSQYRLACGKHFVCFQHLGLMLEEGCVCPACQGLCRKSQ